MSINKSSGTLEKNKNDTWVKIRKRNAHQTWLSTNLQKTPCSFNSELYLKIILYCRNNYQKILIETRCFATKKNISDTIFISLFYHDSCLPSTKKAKYKKIKNAPLLHFSLSFFLCLLKLPSETCRPRITHPCLITNCTQILFYIPSLFTLPFFLLKS